MSNKLTAQQVFNGTGFDDKHMLRKAERELNRLRTARGFEEPFDHMMNFAVSLAAVCDWTFHIRLSSLPRWNGKTERHFTNWVRKSSADAFVFVDISNEYKHANRIHPSMSAEKMMLEYIDLNLHPEARALIDQSKGWIQNVGGKDWFFRPTVKFNGTTEYFYDAAERAISWWKVFIPVNAEPMDVNGNIVP